MSFGHSLAEAPSHHTAQVVVQGSLGHSPDSPLKAPRWRVAPAQDADELAKQEDVALASRLSYVYGWGLVMLEEGDFRLSCIAQLFEAEMLDEKPSQMA
jgi:hypothetical protein